MKTFFLIIPLLVSLVGCATESFDPTKAPEFLVQSDYALFYQLGPGQERGPDASLHRGERVKMLRREFGYSFVEMSDGRAGYIANEDISSAPPVAPLDLPKPTRKPSQRAAVVAENDNATHPLLMPEIEALPEPVDILHPISDMEPGADSKPDFRY